MKEENNISGRWGKLYLFVIVFLLLIIITLYFFTEYFN